MTETSISNAPRTTYRVQFRPDGFTLQDAAEIVPYLERLGVSHLYASPYLQSAPGSTHGYDVVNYQQVNRELGGAAAHAALTAALRSAGLGQVLDMVPNHMAISPSNPWWWDVLENGPASRYAGYFDVDWDPPEARHKDAVLLPVLGDQYGRVLDAGEIRLAFDEDGFRVHYHDYVFPVDPSSLGGILTAAGQEAASGRVDAAGSLRDSDALIFLGGAHERLPASEPLDRALANRRYRDKEVLRAMLDRLVREQPALGEAIRHVVSAVNADPDVLDAFLRRQNYRPAFWKLSARELGYRRFFDINTMIGLCMEDEEVYRDTHRLVVDWLHEGVLDGLRIDHPDGLRDPLGYFRRLRGDAPRAWIVVEKILEHEERLPQDWPVNGATGYDFLNRASGLFVDPAAEAPLTDFYSAFSGRTADFAELALEKKRMAANEVLGSDLNRLTELFLQVCERNRRYRDYTRNDLHDTLSEMAAALPVYRTYIRPEAGGAGPESGGAGPESGVLPEDERIIRETCATVRARRPDLDPRLLEFFADILLLKVRGPVESELVQRFQQFTGPVMAKGVEDTAFYLYNRFISLNEVGGSPGTFGFSPAAFHRACQETQERWPFAMLATSTHDTKRSEDVRARLNVLSEMPQAWMDVVQRWAEMNERHGSGDWPDRNAEYLLYQTLVGAWPITVERVLQYMEKAGREAKAYTSWTAPNQEYESAMAGFIRGILGDRRFIADLEAFVARLVEPGRINALAQALLKLTTPGVPDIYQGTELWDFSLVDPDNRRPVDYALRARLLARLEAQPGVDAIWAGAEEGLPKLWLVRQALELRRRRPEVFGAQGAYRPLRVDEEAAVAYLRGERVVAVAPRLVVRWRAQWGRLRVDLPEGSWHNVLTGEQVQGGSRSLGELLARFPVALLDKE